MPRPNSWDTALGTTPPNVTNILRNKDVRRQPLFTPFIDTKMGANNEPIYLVAMRVPKQVNPSPLVALTDWTFDFALARRQLRTARLIAGEALLDMHRQNTDLVIERSKRPASEAGLPVRRR